MSGGLMSVARGVARFRCILSSDISRKDLATSSPDPDLYSRTTKARQGTCDAFVSHSWSDDEGAKWAALQRWRRSFVAEHGREPTVWVDKCCIDQHSIETDLRCLPIFLGGCKELVVLCGPSYLSRLWCVLELFTHSSMGSGTRALTLVPVLREDHHANDKMAVQKAMEEFDVMDCQCSRREDTDRIMEILLDAFGSTSNFNEAVRDCLRRADSAREPGAETCRSVVSL